MNNSGRPAAENGKVVVYQILVRLFGNKQSTNVPFGTIEENGVGKFQDINDAALVSLRDLGITHVWYTGVIEHATLTEYSAYGIPSDHADVVKGRAGSPYAIRDYYDVDPDLATDVGNRMSEFEELVDRTHRHGLKVIIDFVPNHVARVYHSDARPEGVHDLGESDNPTVAFHPANNFYYLPGQRFVPPQAGQSVDHPSRNVPFEETPAKVTGNDEFDASPGPDSWYETVKLNYGVDILNNGRKYFDPIPDTWWKMLEILRFWADKKVDGFRCDMAQMVPVEFWNWVILQIKSSNPDILFIAEIYDPYSYRNYIETGRFDFLYDKVLLYDTLRGLLKGQGSTARIAGIQSELSGITRHMLHFMENHDEQRIASPHFMGDARPGLPAFLVSATIDTGPILMYFGQEVGEPASGSAGFQRDDGRTSLFDYWAVPEHQKWMNGGRFDGGQLSNDQIALRNTYVRILKFASSNPAIVHGDYADLSFHNSERGNLPEQVCAYARFSERDRVVIVANFSPNAVTVRTHIPASLWERMGLESGRKYVLFDTLSNKEVSLDIDNVFELILNGFGMYILTVN